MKLFSRAPENARKTTADQIHTSLCNIITPLKWAKVFLIYLDCSYLCKISFFSSMRTPSNAQRDLIRSPQSERSIHLLNNNETRSICGVSENFLIDNEACSIPRSSKHIKHIINVPCMFVTHAAAHFDLMRATEKSLNTILDGFSGNTIFLIDKQDDTDWLTTNRQPSLAFDSYDGELPDELELNKNKVIVSGGYAKYCLDRTIRDIILSFKNSSLIKPELPSNALNIFIAIESVFTIIAAQASLETTVLDPEFCSFPQTTRLEYELEKRTPTLTYKAKADLAQIISHNTGDLLAKLEFSISVKYYGKEPQQINEIDNEDRHIIFHLLTTKQLKKEIKDF